MLPGCPKTPVALIYDVVSVDMLAVLIDACGVESDEINIEETCPKVPKILLVVIDDATIDEANSCWNTLPSS
jgi:hypothetical protein